MAQRSLPSSRTALQLDYEAGAAPHFHGVSVNEVLMATPASSGRPQARLGSRTDGGRFSWQPLSQDAEKVCQFALVSSGRGIDLQTLAFDHMVPIFNREIGTLFAPLISPADTKSSAITNEIDGSMLLELYPLCQWHVLILVQKKRPQRVDTEAASKIA